MPQPPSPPSLACCSLHRCYFIVTATPAVALFGTTRERFVFGMFEVGSFVHSVLARSCPTAGEEATAEEPVTTSVSTEAAARPAGDICLQ